jgi:hypothetical protein
MKYTWPDQKVSDHIFLSFKQEGAWGWEWGVCDLRPLYACVNYCLMLRLLTHWHSAKTCCCAYHACHIDDDRES